jgi:plastocyanin
MPRSLLLIPAAVLLLTGCGDSSSAEKPAAAAPSGGTAVKIASFAYKPAALTVRKGARVRFTNEDRAAHTATADDRSFDTQGIEKGGTAQVTLTRAGTFPYHCDFHPFMKGVIVVR